MQVFQLLSGHGLVLLYDAGLYIALLTLYGFPSAS